MKIYVVRHGETNINKENRINSLNDEDINETGIKQAEEAREKLKNVSYDLVICSPLTRTRHTANIINDKGVDTIFDDRLLERDAGIYTKALISTIDINDWWNVNPVNDYCDAESVEDVLKRVYSFLDDINEKYKDETILVVTHGGVCRAIKCYFEGIPEDRKSSKINF